MVVAIILAGGASQRMGSPKSLLRYRDRTFLEGILDATRAVGIERRIVVLGHDAHKILQTIDLSDITVVMSEDLGAGPIGSIRAGIREVLNHPVEGALVWPVDRPHVAVATVQALIDSFASGGRPIAIPAYGGSRGHPVIFGRSVFEELLSAPDELGARAVVRADPDRVLEVPVDDSAVLDDVNTPDEYRDLLRREDQIRDVLF